MEYCLSTVNEFLNDIRTFRNRLSDRKRDDRRYDDSSTDDDEQNHGELAVSPTLNISEHVRRFVRQLLQALMNLHEHRIVHCDVKGDNIFIAIDKGHYIVKLGVSSLFFLNEKFEIFIGGKFLKKTFCPRSNKNVRSIENELFIVRQNSSSSF